MMGMAFLYWGIIYAVVVFCIYMVKHFDTEVWSWTEKEQLTILAGSGINSVIILWISRDGFVKQSAMCLLAVLAGCLLFACMTDCKSCEVFEFTWWMAGVAGGLLLYQRCVADSEVSQSADWRPEHQLVPLLIYLILQEFFFCRFYGRADCHAFVICAVVECALGMGEPGYLLHMTLAFGGLAVVQAFRGNINYRGNLKQPVAFLPYITISFWVLLFFEKSVILNRISETNLIGGLRL